MEPEDLSPDPIDTLRDWLEQAAAAGVDEPTAMCLATVAADGTPDARMVLLKHLDADGLTFYTNLRSTKGEQLAVNPAAALVFHWQALHRQVRVRGTVGHLPDEVADAYFATRPRGSQVGACISDQSRPIGSREDLEARAADLEQRFAGAPIPRPPEWGGYVLTPYTVELWQGRRGRLHDRLRYDRSPDGGWEVTRLQP